jgi:hypothetical protein
VGHITRAWPPILAWRPRPPARKMGTPTLFIDGVVHRGGYDPPAQLAALAP